MVQALLWYQTKTSLRSVDICVFYYAGHAVNISKENYLLPIGSENISDKEIEFMGIKEKDVITQLSEINAKSIVILDACRNPFGMSLSRGKMNAGLTANTGSHNFLIAYSTSPNSTAADGTGRNSPFTKHLLANMKSGVKLQEIFFNTRKAVHSETLGKQTPWTHDSLLEEIYFND